MPPERRIGSPVIDFITSDESEAMQRNRNEAKHTINALILLGTEIQDTLIFSGPHDTCFQELTTVMDSALKTHRIIDAAYSGREKEVEALINDGCSVNATDVWYNFAWPK
jgi:hypothetical protein